VLSFFATLTRGDENAKPNSSRPVLSGAFDAVVARDHLVFKRRKATFDFAEPLTALGNETASFGNEEENSGGENAKKFHTEARRRQRPQSDFPKGRAVTP